MTTSEGGWIAPRILNSQSGLPASSKAPQWAEHQDREAESEAYTEGQARTARASLMSRLSRVHMAALLATNTAFTVSFAPSRSSGPILWSPANQEERFR